MLFCWKCDRSNPSVRLLMTEVTNCVNCAQHKYFYHHSWNLKGLLVRALTALIFDVQEHCAVGNYFLFTSYNLKEHKKDKSYLCVVWFDWWILAKFWVCVFIVHIVTNSNELLAAVRAGYQHYSYTNSITFRYQSSIWGISLWTKHNPNICNNIVCIAF